MAEEIEVFRDMVLKGDIAKRPELRAALIAAATPPWRIDLERSAEVTRNTVTEEDVLLFRCQPGDEYPAAGLTLWGTDDGYYVPNIVPLENGNLTFVQYNAVLADFIAHIVEPVAHRYDFTITTTQSIQVLEDWVSADAAIKLRRFSGAANKSTGASHPMDERRWFDFLIAIHRAGDELGPDRLARWLHEAEGWDEDTAHKLAGDFENGLALLAHYDKN
jgi:hypothetical protein